MIQFKVRAWVGLGAVALAGLAACGPGGEGGEAGQVNAAGAGSAAASAGEGEGEGASPANGVAAPAATAATAGGEGEAGASNAYAVVPQGSAFALRVTNLSGFALAARQLADAGKAAEASVLVSQGLLEVHSPHAAQFNASAPGVKPAFDALVSALDAGKPKPELEAAFAKALASVDSAASGSDGKAVVEGMLSITGGLYQGAVRAGGNDPIEYLHAYGAALATQAAFMRAEADLTRRDATRAARLKQEIAAIVALFPTPELPDAPASVADVLAAASRAQLSLSGIR